MAKILITGSRGFIAKNLIELYNDQELYLYDKDKNISLSLNYFSPDVIINCAAEIYNPDLMWESNIVLLQKILDYVKQNPNTILIQIGSSSEYGKVTRAASETDRVNPVDMYQATKGAATILCQGYARQYGLPITIARPYSVYGKYEKPHRLFPRLWKAFKLDEPMKLFQGYHDFIYIKDFIRGIDSLIKYPTHNGDIVNFGSGKQYSNTEVLQIFESVTNKKANVETVYSMAKTFESNVWLCDTTYARNQYKFQTEFSLEDGIKDFLATAIYTKD